MSFIQILALNNHLGRVLQTKWEGVKWILNETCNFFLVDGVTDALIPI